jgi:multiple antibiotic resistance protein
VGEEASGIARTALLTAAALLPIINPLSVAPILLSMTEGATRELRKGLARQISVNGFGLLLGAAFIGTYVLDFFGISLAVVKVGGGLLLGANAWKLLSREEDVDDKRRVAASAGARESYLRRAFFPLTFPLTVGPGAISVAVTLGARAPARGWDRAAFEMAGLVLGFVLCALAVYLSFRYAGRLEEMAGETGSVVVARLSAFILLCIGVQIFWGGAVELMGPYLPEPRASGG